jgi:hypothetical protein
VPIAIVKTQRMGFPSKRVREAQLGRKLNIEKLNSGQTKVTVDGQPDIHATANTQGEAVRLVQKALLQETTKSDSKIKQSVI